MPVHTLPARPATRRTLARLVALAVAAGLVAACGSGGPSAGATTAPSPTAPASVPGSPAGSPGTAVDATAIGRAFVEALAAGDMAAAEAMEDPTMRAAAPATALAQLWGQITGQFGAYQGIDGVTAEAQDPWITATVRTRFEQATLPLLVTVSADGQVAGLHLGEPGPASSGAPATPTASPSPAADAPYVDPAAFTETEVTVGDAPWALPGTLAMPAGSGPFPAVVLLAGSGPNDRDETIGPNAPLRDLARGLASNGIATLRYDKRTLAHQAEMAAMADTITVREEVIDDALAAVDQLRATPGIDPARVVVVGHSLGGYLAPRIAEAADGRVAGIGVLAGNARPLHRVVADQLAYLASPEGGGDPQAAAMLEALPDQVARVEDPALSPSIPASELPLGIPAAYWLDLRGYDPVAVAAALEVPVFVGQGGRDYQVPPSELALWRAGLAGEDAVTVREYPALNHLLLAGEGPSRPAEYAIPGHVSADLVADLVAWVREAVTGR